MKFPFGNMTKRIVFNGIKKVPTSIAASTDTEKHNVVDGWKPGQDPKVDHSGHVEFGGSWGTSAMILGFPLLMYYMWIGAIFYDGKFPLPTTTQSGVDFIKHLGNLVFTYAFPTSKAWKIYWAFLLFEAACYCLLPGIWGYGKPLDHEGGKQLKYFCNGVWSFYVTICVAALLHFTEVFPLYTIIEHFGPLISVAIVSGFIVSFIARFSALARNAQHRMTGRPVYDFFMGAELNPRIGILDLKMFLMLRIPWFMLLAFSCATAALQYQAKGYISAEVIFLVMAHFLYANAIAKGEELILTTWDIYYEKWGFMLIFWNLAGVPLSYCHCSLYMANHLDTISEWSIPSARTPVLTTLFVSYLFVYWAWDTSNSQKNRFRAQERGTLVQRKAFPQLPWQTIQNPRMLVTSSGSSLLVDGWYGFARKIHYTCDLYFALAWGAVTGFKSPFPWFYPVFFCCMILHRAHRDVQRCKAKYGRSWEEYENLVPWQFIPYLF